MRTSHKSITTVACPIPELKKEDSTTHMLSWKLTLFYSQNHTSKCSFSVPKHLHIFGIVYKVVSSVSVFYIINITCKVFLITYKVSSIIPSYGPLKRGVFILLSIGVKRRGLVFCRPLGFVITRIWQFLVVISVHMSPLH